jgi:hypothetical protein
LTVVSYLKVGGSWGAGPAAARGPANSFFVAAVGCVTTPNLAVMPAVSHPLLLLLLLLVLQNLTAAALTSTPDYSVLSRRISSSRETESTVQCLPLKQSGSCMVPGQRATFQFTPPTSDVLKRALKSGSSLVCVGTDHTEGKLLRRGVEVRVESASEFRKTDGFFSSHALSPYDAPNMRGYMALDTVLVAGRRCEILVDDGGSTDQSEWPPIDPIFPARVRWIKEESCGTAAAVLAAEKLPALIAEWQETLLSTKRERGAGQLHDILAQLGPMPDPENSDDLAFWTAALVNPLPALGVCKEVRPYILQVDDALTRVQLMQKALEHSIGLMRRLPHGSMEVEPPPTSR